MKKFEVMRKMRTMIINGKEIEETIKRGIPNLLNSYASLKFPFAIFIKDLVIPQLRHSIFK